jgi:uncharacterized protein involved in outer membrane biogenesis
MKKLLTISCVVIAVVVIGLVLSYTLLGSVVRKGHHHRGPAHHGHDRGTGCGSAFPAQRQRIAHRLMVGNPPGWQSDRAFYLGHIQLNLEPMSLLGDAIVVEEITIERPHFVYETKLVSSNIKDLLANIEKATGGPAEPEQTTESAPRKFIVKKFTLTDGEVTLGVGAAAIKLPLPPITLNNLGVKEGGITAGQLAGAVMRSVLADIGSATARAAGRIGAASGAVATDAIGSAATKAGEGLKKLFGKDDKDAPKDGEPKR